MKSKIFKIVAWIIGILGGVSSIAAGFQFPTSTYNSATEEFTTGFNMGMTVICLISVAVLCMIFAGISCILKKLEFLCGEQETEETTESESSDTSSEDKWECPNCHALNSYTDNAECWNCHWKA